MPAARAVLGRPERVLVDASDTALLGWAYVGLALAVALALGYANLPMLLALWLIYGSYERIGQLWFAFGWEIQILETTLLAAFLAHPWDPRPLAARPPPVTAIVLMRWLAFRIMLGAGLIKLRGSSVLDRPDVPRLRTSRPSRSRTRCRRASTTSRTSSTPAGVAFNHLVEVIAPWFVFGPRRLRLVAGCAMAAFQLVLISSGNLAFLNWLTLVPILACFDDDFLRRLVPPAARVAGSTPAPADPPPRDGLQLRRDCVRRVGLVA